MAISPAELQRFSDLDYAGFSELAQDESLSNFQKIGFPDEYRKGYEDLIFSDICSKVSLSTSESKTVLDIGPGCSDLPKMIINTCATQEHNLILVDNPEMLSLLPDANHIHKVTGPFPDCVEEISRISQRIDIVVCYSVLHYVFANQNLFSFLDAMLTLIQHGGEILLGDIPNLSKRNRFFSTKVGKQFHREFMNVNEDPVVTPYEIKSQNIDDSILHALMTRAQSAGFDAYWLFQPPSLPMANRRDDLLIRKPWTNA